MSSLVVKASAPSLRQELEQKYQLGLQDPRKLKPLRGLTTGYTELDQFLPWQGLPANGLSLFRGEKGQGATQLWLDTAASCLERQQWVAWVNSNGLQLNPAPLLHKKMNLAYLLSINAEKSQASWFWLIEELLSLSLFQLIGSSLPDQKLRSSQLQKLRQLSQRYQVALILFGRHCPPFLVSQFDLILQFQQSQVLVERSRFRPAFHFLRRKSDENTVLKIQPRALANSG